MIFHISLFFLMTSSVDQNGDQFKYGRMSLIMLKLRALYVKEGDIILSDVRTISPWSKHM